MSKTVKILSGICVAIGIAFASTDAMAAGNVTGSCIPSAVQLTMQSLEQKAYPTLVDEWYPDFNLNLGYGAFYYRLPLFKGEAYTVWLTDQSDSSVYIMSIQTDWEDPVQPWAYFSNKTLGGIKYWMMESKTWGKSDPSSGNYYVYVTGPIGSTAVLHYQKGIVIPFGLPENPEVLSVPEGSYETASRNAVNIDNTYCFTMELIAGRQYLFKTTNGSEANVTSLSLYRGTGVTAPVEPVEIDAGAYNVGYTFVPLQSGSYLLTLKSSVNGGQISFQYGSKPGQRPSQHTKKADLVPGVPVRFVPGLENRADSPYYDNVIDECLFAFTAEAGRRYAVETSGAQAPMLMRIYTDAGDVLAENRVVSAMSYDVRAAFQPVVGGTYYVGACEDIAEGENRRPVGAEISIRLMDVDDVEPTDDQYDPADDVLSGASRLDPTLTADYGANPAAVGKVAHSGHTLSLTDWSDWFAIDARAGFEYRIKAISVKGAATGLTLAAEVMRADGNTELQVVSGDLSPEQNGWLSLTPLANGTYCIRISVAEGEGLDYPTYSVRCCAYSESAGSYGMLTVNAKGPSSDSGATWKIGTDASEPQYPFGTSIPYSGAYTLNFSAVPGFATPSPVSGSISSGAKVETALYKDQYDPGDDIQSGAVALSFTSQEKSDVSRTLWCEGANPDLADWFKFTAVAGVNYAVKFAEKTGDPKLTMFGPDLRELASDTERISFLAPSAGTYYLRVAANGAPVDSSYKLAYSSANVGMVKFDVTEQTVSEDAGTVSFRIGRTSKEGAVCIRYGTVAGSAVAGTDYEPVGGELSWANGDDSAKTVTIRIYPDLVPEYEGERTFSLRLDVPTEDELPEGAYAPGISGPDVCRVTITDDETDRNAGVIGFTSWTSGKSGFADAAVPEITVAPGSALRLWLSRVGGANGEAGVGVTLNGDACAAVRTATVLWTSTDAADKAVGVEVAGVDDYDYGFDSPGGPFVKTFTVEASGLLGGAPTAIGAGRVIVHVDPTGSNPPGTDPVTTGEVRLAAGSYRGVLVERDRSTQWVSLDVAELSVTADTGSNVTATVRLGGEMVRFNGTFDTVEATGEFGWASATLTSVTTVDEISYTNVLTISLDNGSLVSRERSAVCENAVMKLYVPNDDGLTVSRLTYEGPICRDNRGMATFETVISRHVGKYTVALSPLATSGNAPGGDGFLTFEIAGDGSVSGKGRYADGLEIPQFNVFASVVGDTLGGNERVQIPLYYCNLGYLTFGGTLTLGKDVRTGVTAVLPDELYAGYGEFSVLDDDPEAYRCSLNPVGGAYDERIPPMTAFKDAELTFSVGDLPVEVGPDGFVINADGVSVEVDRQTGVVVGTVDHDVVWQGVLLQGTAANAGYDKVVVSGYREDTWGLVQITRAPADHDDTEDWGFTSTLSFDGNGNTAGSAPDPIVAEVNELVTIPKLPEGCIRPGYEFVCWRDAEDNDYHPGEVVPQFATDTTLKAIWTFSVVGIPEALGCADKGYVFIGGGSAPWYPQSEKVRSGEKAIRSGAIGDNQESWLETKVEGEGLVSFYWAVSSEEGYDKLKLFIDGVEKAAISGDQDWTSVKIQVVGPGSHTIRWSYVKDKSGSKLQDCGWVDDFSFGPTIRVTFDPNGGRVDETEWVMVIGTLFGALPEAVWDLWDFNRWKGQDGLDYTADSIVPDYDLQLKAQWKAKFWKASYDGNGADEGEPPVDGGQYSGLYLILPGPGSLVRRGYEFVGWDDGSGVPCKEGEPYLMPTANVAFKACWSLSVKGVAEALDCQLEFTAGGNAGWYPQDDYYVVGTNALRSGKISSAQSTWVQAAVNGAGEVSFQWAVSSESRYDKVTFLVDGVEIASISGEVSWTPYTHTITGDKPHTLQWRYSKDNSGDRGQDCAWLDGVMFGKTMIATFDPGEYGTLPESELTRKYVCNQPYLSLPVPASDTKGFVGWYDGEQIVGVDTIVPERNVDFIAVWSNLSWTVSFDANGGTGPQMPSVTAFEGESIELPTCTYTRANSEFACWIDSADNKYVPGVHRFTIPVGGMTLKAKWTLTVEGIGEALENTSLGYMASGDAAWKPSATEPGIESGAIGTNQKSVLEAVVEGEGMVSFDWAVSSAQNHGICTFAVDGVTVASISGDEDWSRFDWLIEGGGQHTLTWTYEKDAVSPSGSDLARLAHLKFGPTIDVTFDCNGFGEIPESERVRKFVVGGTFGELPTLECDEMAFVEWWLGADPCRPDTFVPDHDVTLKAVWAERQWTISFEGNGGTGSTDPITCLGGQQATLPACGFSLTGKEFANWEDEAGNPWSAGAPFPLVDRRNHVLKATWTLSVAGIAEALGSEDIAYTASGDLAWVPSVTGDFVESGKITHNQESVLTAKVAGSGMVFFDWAVSSEQNYDKLTFSIDGTEIETISGDKPNWVHVEREIVGDTTHTLSWKYFKDGTGSKFQDKGMLANLKFGRTLEVTFDPRGGTMPDDDRVRKYIVGDPFGDMPEPASTNVEQSFYGWIDASLDVYAPTNSVPDVTELALYAVWGPRQFKIDFDANGGVGDPIATIRGFKGERITIPENTFEKTGYEFVCWTDLTGAQWFPGDTNYVIKAEDTVLTALWSFSTKGIGKALGNTTLTYVTTGNLPWVPDESGTFARSGMISDKQISVLETTVQGPGVVSFDWAVSSEANSDTYTFAVDSNVVATISGTVDWEAFEHQIATPGAHTLQWVYAKDGSVARGEDCAKLAKLRFGKPVTISFDVQGEPGVTVDPRRYFIGETFGSLPMVSSEKRTVEAWLLDGVPVREDDSVPETNSVLVAQWGDRVWDLSFTDTGSDYGTAPEALHGKPGAVMQIPGPGTLGKAGYVFLGWTGADGKVWAEGRSYTFGAFNETLSPKWSLPAEGLAEALGCPGRIFSTSGNAAWVVGPVKGVASGVISDSQSSTLETVLEGKGPVKFDLSVSSEARYDKLSFYVDGKMVQEFSGTVDWTPYVYEIVEDGVHTLTWTYSKDGSRKEGDDRAYLANFSFGSFPSVNGVMYDNPADFLAAAKSGTEITLPAGWSVEGNLVKDAGGLIWAAMAPYYSIFDSHVVLDAAMVTPVIADAAGAMKSKAIEVDVDEVRLTITNAFKGLWYGYVKGDDVRDVELGAATGWAQPTEDGDYVISIPKEAAESRAFYRIVVSDWPPEP